jgi:hypothetical protein
MVEKQLLRRPQRPGSPAVQFGLSVETMNPMRYDDLFDSFRVRFNSDNIENETHRLRPARA